MGDEGGFAPNIADTEEGLELLAGAIDKAGYSGKVKIGFDAAPSAYYSEDKKTYDLKYKQANNDGSGVKSGYVMTFGFSHWLQWSH